MNMYCPKCKHIVEGIKCPDCKKPTREPREDDVCLLTEKPAALGEMLADVLRQNGIQPLCMGALGAGLSTLLGANIEYLKIYTDYSDRERALELCDELFGGNTGEEAEPGAGEGEEGAQA